jgi:hypothetical protein
MTQNKIRIDLQRGPDDPEENAPEFQEELKAFHKSLRSAGVVFSVPRKHLASAGAPEFLSAALVITALGPPIISAVKDAFVVLVQARNGRKARLKIGDVVEAEGESAAEIEDLLNKARNFLDAVHAKGGET